MINIHNTVKEDAPFKMPTQLHFTGGFDNKISKDGLRKIFIEMKNGMTYWFDSDVKFGPELKSFANAIVNSEQEFSIISENIDLLSAINYELELPVNSVLVIDTHNFYHRNFHALPRMYSADGTPTTLLKSLSGLIKWFNVSKYSHIVFATESKNSLRVEYTKSKLGNEAAYKANRSETDPELKQQIKLCEAFLTDIGYKPLAVDGYEADDVIASIAATIKSPVHVLSADKDLCQLFEYENFRIIDTKTKELLDESYLIEKFLVPATMFVDYQAIVGDTTDNVSGIPGIGKVGAVELLEEFSTLENIFANIENIKKKGMREKVEAGAESGSISKDLVFMRRDLLTDIDMKKYSKNLFIQTAIKKHLSKFQIN